MLLFQLPKKIRYQTIIITKAAKAKYRHTTTNHTEAVILFLTKLCGIPGVYGRGNRSESIATVAAPNGDGITADTAAGPELRQEGDTAGVKPHLTVKMAS